MFKRKHKPTVPENTIVTSDAAQHKAAKTTHSRGLKLRPKKKVVVGSALAIVLVTAAIGCWLLIINKPKPLAVKTPQQAINDVNNQFENSGRDPAVLQATQDELTRRETEASNKADKQLFASEAVSLYQQAGKVDDALTRAQKADSTYQSSLTAAVLAGVYRAKGDYANAAKYYGIASERSPKTATTERSPYNDYRLMKEEMERHL